MTPLSPKLAALRLTAKDTEMLLARGLISWNPASTDPIPWVPEPKPVPPHLKLARAYNERMQANGKR
jgi:hypothetical protein